MNSKNTFIEFCRNLKLGRWNFDFKKYKTYYEFTLDEMQKFYDLNIVFNGQNGGLILGNLHVQGGIHLIQPNIEKGIFKYMGEMEGWEYLSSPIMTEKYGIKLVEFNNLEKVITRNELTEFEIPINCRVVDTLKCSNPILLLSEYTQFILNRFATKKYINQLIEFDIKTSANRVM